MRGRVRRIQMAGLWKHFQDGGWGMYPIVLWSIITIGIIVERSLYLFGSSINKDVFLATMQKCILAGDVAKAVRFSSPRTRRSARLSRPALLRLNGPQKGFKPRWIEPCLGDATRFLAPR